MAESKSLVDKLFLPDGGPYSLSTAMAARSGSGKTTLLTRLMEQANGEKYRDVRFVYVSVKGEHLFGPKVPITTDIEALQKALVKNRVVVYYPVDPEYYDEDVDSIIDLVFALAAKNDKASFNLIIDDANVLDGFTNVGRPSPQVKKLVIAGRSKRIRGFFILHRLGNLPRLMNGNLSNLVIMNINPMDNDYAKKIFGMDFDELTTDLTDFKWAHVDLITESVDRYNPVPSL